MKFFKAAGIMLLVSCTLFIQAQHTERSMEHETEAHDHSEEHEFKHHKISLVIGHTHIPAGNPDEGRVGTVIAPSWGIDYEYWFNHKWAVGLHTDLEMISYVIDNEERSELERERPFIISVVGLFKPINSLVVYVGPGIELEKNENFMVYRFGVEYEFEMGKHWELSPGIFYDSKEGIYDSWSVGLAVGKRF
ncbi:MAG: porin family protein [Cyclobacteriaceae bacterium]|nr:porin family protein [Cyclobacteriaceae bacterium]